MKDKLRALIEDKAIQRSADGAVLTAPDGRLQDWALDMKLVMLDPAALDIITEMFWNHYRARLPFQLGAVETGGVPLLTALLLKARRRGLNVNGFIIRKDRSQSGSGRRIEGTVTDVPIILVDDLVDSAASLDMARIVLEAEAYTVREVFAVLDHRSPRGMAWRKAHNILVTAIFQLTAFGLKAENQQVAPVYKYHIPWRFFPGPPGNAADLVPKCTPLYHEGRLYTGHDDGRFWCIDSRTGQDIWSFTAPECGPRGICAAPALHGGRIYFGAANGNLYCLNSHDGTLVWEKNCAAAISSDPLIVPDQGRLYIGLEYERPRQKGAQAAFDLETGALIWEQPTQEREQGAAIYCADHNLIIFGSCDGAIIACAPESGEIVWRFDTGGPVMAAPAFDAQRGLVAAASFDKHIYLIDAASGAQRAAFETGNICYAAPLITGGRLYCGSTDKNLYVIDLDKMALVKAIPLRARIFAAPRLIAGHIVLGTAGGWLVEIDPQGLDIKGTAPLPDAITNAVCADESGDTLYVATYMNELYALERAK